MTLRPSSDKGLPLESPRVPHQHRVRISNELTGVAHCSADIFDILIDDYDKRHGALERRGRPLLLVPATMSLRCTPTSSQQPARLWLSTAQVANVFGFPAFGLRVVG
jgi:hypothetical protein